MMNTNPSDKENNPFTVRKLMTPSLKSDKSLDQGESMPGNNLQINAGILAGQAGRPPFSVSKFSVLKAKANKEVVLQVHSLNNPEEEKIIPIAHSNNHSDHLMNVDNNNQDTLPVNNPSVTNLTKLTKSKRKFTELQKEKEEAKKDTRHLCSEISELYFNYVTKHSIPDEEFTIRLAEILDREKVLNISKLLPECLNTRGSCLLENSKFFLLLIKYKSLTSATGLTSGIEVPLPMRMEDFLSLVDNCLEYDQSDIKLVHEFFTGFIRDNYGKDTVHQMLESRSRKLMSIEEVTEGSYKFLLSRPENFQNFEFSDLKSATSGKVHKGSKDSKGNALTVLTVLNGFMSKAKKEVKEVEVINLIDEVDEAVEHVEVVEVVELVELVREVIDLTSNNSRIREVDFNLSVSVNADADVSEPLPVQALQDGNNSHSNNSNNSNNSDKNNSNNDLVNMHSNSMSLSIITGTGNNFIPCNAYNLLEIENQNLFAINGSSIRSNILQSFIPVSQVEKFEIISSIIEEVDSNAPIEDKIATGKTRAGRAKSKAKAKVNVEEQTAEDIEVSAKKPRSKAKNKKRYQSDKKIKPDDSESELAVAEKKGKGKDIKPDNGKNAKTNTDEEDGEVQQRGRGRSSNVKKKKKTKKSVDMSAKESDQEEVKKPAPQTRAKSKKDNNKQTQIEKKETKRRKSKKD